MTKRIQKLGMAVAALAALALGGAVFAQAQSSTKASPEKVSATDPPGNVQSGDQTTPDASASKTKARARHHATRAASGGKDVGNVQSGDQTTPDTSAATSETSGTESSSETASESAPSDGPGGHADAPGSANADNQFQGNQ